MQFSPLPPPPNCPFRGVPSAFRPAEVTDGSPPPPADVPLIESIFFYQTFSPLSVDFPRLSSRRTRRLPSPREVGVRCPLYIVGVKQSADCLHSPLLRPFLPTDAVSRTKQHRGTPETPYPEPKQTARRWKCRIFNLSKCFGARYVVSLTFQNILVLEMPYPGPKQTSASWKRRIRNQNKRRQTGNVVSESKRNARPSSSADHTPPEAGEVRKTDNKSPVRLSAPRNAGNRTAARSGQKN